MNEEIYQLGVKALITNPEGAILLVKYDSVEADQHYWDLPGGRVQKGESAESTLAREIEEELGWTNVVVTGSMGMVLSRIRVPLMGSETAGLILSVYRCHARLQPVVLSEEHSTFEWFSPRDAAELLAIKYPSDFCELVEQTQNH